MAATKTIKPRASFLKASLWMIGLSILLFWLPILGPVVAGRVLTRCTTGACCTGICCCGIGWNWAVYGLYA